jgi:hypothetical protein
MHATRVADRSGPLKQYLEFAESFAVIALVLAGLSGLSFHLFKDEGWIEELVGDIWEIHVQYPLIAIPLTVGAIVLGNMWRENRIGKGELSKLPNYFLYLLMATGAFFISRVALYGTF